MLPKALTNKGRRSHEERTLDHSFGHAMLCVVCTCVFLPGSLTEKIAKIHQILSSAQVQPLQAEESVLAPIADQEPRAAIPAEPP